MYRYVVPQYAHKWRYLGALLHFEQPELDIIYSNFRNDVEECCRSLLSRWLNKNHDASWNQLFSAIDNLIPLSGTVYQGVLVITAKEIFGWLLAIMTRLQLHV